MDGFILHNHEPHLFNCYVGVNDTSDLSLTNIDIS